MFYSLFNTSAWVCVYVYIAGCGQCLSCSSEPGEESGIPSGRNYVPQEASWSGMRVCYCIPCYYYCVLYYRYCFLIFSLSHSGFSPSTALFLSLDYIFIWFPFALSFSLCSHLCLLLSPLSPSVWSHASSHAVLFCLSLRLWPSLSLSVISLPLFSCLHASLCPFFFFSLCRSWESYKLRPSSSRRCVWIWTWLSLIWPPPSGKSGCSMTIWPPRTRTCRRSGTTPRCWSGNVFSGSRFVISTLISPSWWSLLLLLHLFWNPLPPHPHPLDSVLFSHALISFTRQTADLKRKKKQINHISISTGFHSLEL